jgi:predicted alpha/beta superfamily hydrolase
LVKDALSRLAAGENRQRTLYLASSGEEELALLTQQLAEVLRKSAPANLRLHYEPMPDQAHATIYHLAALLALRRLFKPASGDR